MSDRLDDSLQTTPGFAIPPGNSAVEIAARCGFGPLSPLAAEQWHGDSRPCVSCGQLVHRASNKCDSCGEDLSVGKIQTMRAHAGPWYVLEHVRPFPGVTHERLLRQIRRGVLTATTIVRGPTTDHQWRYACETPGLSKHLGKCWVCQKPVTPAQTSCTSCGVDLGELTDMPVTAAAAGAPPRTHPDSQSAELERLAEVAATIPAAGDYLDDAPRVGVIRVSWIVAAILVVVTAILFAVVRMRDRGTRGTDAAPAAKSQVAAPGSMV